MSVTITRAFSSLALKAVPSFNYDEAVDKLTTILEKFENNEDSTSKKIFKWGVQIIENVLENPQIDEATFLKNLAKKIEEFKMTISFDPMNDFSFEDHPSHQFVLEIFSLIHEVSAHIDKLGQSIFSPGNELTHLPLNQVIDAEPISPEYVLKKKLEKKEKKIAKQKEKKKFMEIALQQFNRHIEASRSNTCMIIEQTKKQAVQHELELTTRLKEIEGLYLGRMTGLETTIADLKEKHEGDLSRLHKRMELIDQANEVVSEATKDQLDALIQQQEQTVTTVQGKIKNMEETHKYEMHHVKAACRAELNSQAESMRKLKSELHEAKERNKVNENSNDANASRVRALEWQLARTQDELSNSGGFSCVIS